MSRAWAKGSTRAWRRIRVHVLARDGYRCRIQLPGCIGRANAVHHTIDRTLVGDDPNFLIAACQACNNKIGNPTRYSQRHSLTIHTDPAAI